MNLNPPIDRELPVGFTWNRDVGNFSFVMSWISATEKDFASIFRVVEVPVNQMNIWRIDAGISSNQI
jgi:hypothetical protein